MCCTAVLQFTLATPSPRKSSELVYVAIGSGLLALVLGWFANGPAHELPTPLMRASFATSPWLVGGLAVGIGASEMLKRFIDRSAA
jgi:hypothetical protein